MELDYTLWRQDVKSGPSEGPGSSKKQLFDNQSYLGGAGGFVGLKQELGFLNLKIRAQKYVPLAPKYSTFTDFQVILNPIILINA